MGAVPRLAVLLFTRKKASSMENKQTSQTCSKDPTRVCMVSPDHLSPTPANFSTMKTQKTQKRTLMTLNPQMKEIIQM